MRQVLFRDDKRFFGGKIFPIMYSMDQKYNEGNFKRNHKINKIKIDPVFFHIILSIPFIVVMFTEPGFDYNNYCI